MKNAAYLTDTKGIFDECLPLLIIGLAPSTPWGLGSCADFGYIIDPNMIKSKKILPYVLGASARHAGGRDCC